MLRRFALDTRQGRLSVIAGKSVRTLRKLFKGLAHGVLVCSELAGILPQPADGQELREAFLGVARRFGSQRQEHLGLGLNAGTAEVILQLDQRRQVMRDVAATAKAQEQTQQHHRTTGEDHDMHPITEGRTFSADSIRA